MHIQNRLFSKGVTNRQNRLVISLLAALGAYIACYFLVLGVTTFMLTWMTFAIIHILLSWFVILSFHPTEVKEIAGEEDPGSSFIFLFVVLAAFISLFAIIVLLQTIPSISKRGLSFHILLSLASVSCSWVLIHTLFTFKYAHMYYAATSAGATNTPAIDFANEPEPDYLDFAYFSFVLGMTFQVSDATIQSRAVRRLALLHSFLSFVYNTIIVALSINVVYGIISK